MLQLPESKSEAGGPSLPAHIEANPSRRDSQARAETRAARAVFLCSAPLVDLRQPHAGLSLPSVRLACAEAETARTNPGSELMVEVFKIAGPSLILLDELVTSATSFRPASPASLHAM